VSSTLVRPAPRGPSAVVLRPLLVVLVWLAVAAVSFRAAVVLPTAPIEVILLAVFGVTCTWMLLSSRYKWTLAVVLLYVALADGFIRLRTGTSELTLLRDGLLYAVVIGAVVRTLVRRDRVEVPPLTGWVVAFVAAVFIQLANPANGTLAHSVASLRPHLEWVPLFFLGYYVMRSTKRIRVFLVLLLVVATANGFANVVQLSMSLDELASWGPGYYQRVWGTGDVSGRYYKAGEDRFTGVEILRTRAFGLGSDIGFGGVLAMLALPGGLALISLNRFGWRSWLYIALTGGAIFAVLTSSQRTAVVSAVVAAGAFALLASSRRRLPHLVTAVVLTGLLTFGVGSALSGGSIGALNRYYDIVPGQVLTTTYEARQGTLSLVPRYAAEFPLGAGIGSLGPAAGLGGAGRPNQELNGESEFTFLIVELGLLGLVALLGLNVKLLGGAWRRLRRMSDDRHQVLLAALTAPLFALLATWIVGAPTSNTPGSPYFWFVAGTLAYWLFRRSDGQLPENSPPPISRRTPAASPPL
jgi:hypothetical protein